MYILQIALSFLVGKKYWFRIVQEQLHEREKYILELEMKLDDKDRELDALKIDHQTVSALCCTSEI